MAAVPFLNQHYIRTTSWWNDQACSASLFRQTLLSCDLWHQPFYCWLSRTSHACWSGPGLVSEVRDAQPPILMATYCYDKDLQTDFYLFYSVYWYWSHSDSHLTLLPASGPIVCVDSCAARCCDSELRLTVHCCALWPIVAVTLLFALPIVLLRYISQACWVLCSPRLDFFHRTVISTLVAANRLKIPTLPCLIPLKVIHCNVPKWHTLVNYFSSETI